MLFGRFDNSIDEYNRMFMPSKYCEDFDLRAGELGIETGLSQGKQGKLRKDYEGRCVIVHGVDKCLYAFTQQGFTDFIKELEGLPEDDENIRDLLRHYYTTANYCDIDKQGRVTIPPTAREYAGISKDLATVGMNNKVEIWDRRTYEEAVSGINAKELSNYASKLKSRLKSQKDI
ncbi:transcriptional regulator MraZ [Clostridia bacterium]|nr:transcriptional regulator MraZ [Clostridia bacterium]